MNSLEMDININWGEVRKEKVEELMEKKETAGVLFFIKQTPD